MMKKAKMKEEEMNLKLILAGIPLAFSAGIVAYLNGANSEQIIGVYGLLGTAYAWMKSH